MESTVVDCKPIIIIPASHTSALIAASEPSNQSTSTQNPVVQKFMDSTESNVGPSKERKPAWNIPSHKESQELEYPIICSAAWPALTANTSSLASHKSSSTTSSSSTDDLKSLSDISVVSVPPETTVVVPVRQQSGPNPNPNLMSQQGSTDSENTREPQINNRSSRWTHGQNRHGYNNNHYQYHHNNNNGGRGYRGRGRGGANWNHSWNNSSRPPYVYQGNHAMTTPQPAVSYGYGIPNVYPNYYTSTGYDYSHAMYGHVPLTNPQWIAPSYVEVLELRNSILKQIEYYFSIENLVTDTHLRKKMDEQGWVSIYVVAGFKRVKQMSGNLQFILESLNASTVVEVQGNKIRRRENWMTWILPPSLQVEPVANQPKDPTIGSTTANSSRIDLN